MPSLFSPFSPKPSKAKGYFFLYFLRNLDKVAFPFVIEGFFLAKFFLLYPD